MEAPLSLSLNGYVTHWLVSGPCVHPFYAPNDQPDQLAYEKKLRGLVRDEDIAAPPEAISLGAPYLERRPWQYHDTKGSWFVEILTRGSGLKRVDVCAATGLAAARGQTVRAILWTYAALDLWVNGEKCAVVESGVYKPMLRRELALDLKPGVNRIFVRMQALAVRDTRTIFGLQLLDAQGIGVMLPDAQRSHDAARAALWLRSIRHEQGSLLFDPPACQAFALHGGERASLAGQTSYPVPKGVGSLAVEAQAQGQTLKRTLEFPEFIGPALLPPLPVEETRQRYLDLIGAAEKIPRGPDTFFAGYQILARFATGSASGLDYDLIDNDLSVIESRKDCSEFIAVAILRLAKRYDLGTAAMREIRRVFLDYRFWMDEAGGDGMCFWSENHALMFYGTQLVAGGLFPGDVFTRSGRTGRQQAAIAARRCREWLDDVLENGFEEFLSANYVPVTLGALLNLIDFGPEDIGQKAAKVLDMQFDQVALHAFDGSVIAPQGRVYREAIRPCHQDVQGVLHYLLGGDIPYMDSWWLSALATSRYRPDTQRLQALAGAPVSTEYSSGNAKIVLHRTKEYVLTSVACPSGDARRWENRFGDPKVSVGQNEYVKSLNEKFHGTSYFTPGQNGYQQHMWYGALTREAVVFTNHPGNALDGGALRPGYWNGNGVMPAQKQEGNMLAQIFCIGDDHPIDFVHLYFPQVKFDESLWAEGWLFARARNGLLGLWCSHPLTPYDDVLAGCEWRANSRRVAFLCRLSSLEESGSFEAFQRECVSLHPAFDMERLALRAGAGFELRFEFARDHTQHVG